MGERCFANGLLPIGGPYRLRDDPWFFGDHGLPAIGSLAIHPVRSRAARRLIQQPTSSCLPRHQRGSAGSIAAPRISAHFSRSVTPRFAYSASLLSDKRKALNKPGGQRARAAGLMIVASSIIEYPPGADLLLRSAGTIAPVFFTCGYGAQGSGIAYSVVSQIRRTSP